MALRKTAVVVSLAMLVASAAPPRAQTPAPAKPPAEFCREFYDALDSGDVDKALRMMRAQPKAGQFVLDRIPMRQSAALTGFKAKQRFMQEVMRRSLEAMPPELRSQVVSFEVGGTAGALELERLGAKEPAYGFNPGKSDLDWQIRAKTPEAAEQAAEVAQRIMERMQVPSDFRINVFPAFPDEGVALPTDSRSYREQWTRSIERGQARLANPESSIWDARQAVQRDMNRRGIVYQVNNGEVSFRPRPAADFYEELGIKPPPVTAETAFGEAANEFSKFKGLGTDPKRIGRAVEALRAVGFNFESLPPEQRRMLDVAQQVRSLADPVLALELRAQDKTDPIGRRYEEFRAKKFSPGDAAKLALMELDRDAERFLSRAVEQTFRAKLEHVDRVRTMSDAQFLEYVAERAKTDRVTGDWLRAYQEGGARQSEMLRTAKRFVLQSERLGLGESFAALDRDTRTSLEKSPRFASHPEVKNAKVYANILNGEVPRAGTKPFLRLLGRANSLMAADAESALGKASHRAGQLMTVMLAAGILWDLHDVTAEAYESGGTMAAAGAFTKALMKTGGELAFGLALFTGGQYAGYMAEIAGWLPAGATAVAVGAIILRDLVRMEQALLGKAWQSWLVEPRLNRYLDEDNPDSLFASLKINADLFAIELPFWAATNGYSTHLGDAEAMLGDLVDFYLIGRPALKDLREQFLAVLRAEYGWNQQLLADLDDVAATEVALMSGEIAVEEERDAQQRQQREFEARKAEAQQAKAEADAKRQADEERAFKEKAKADAEEALRKSRARERKEEAEARAKKEAEEKKKAEAEALKKQQEQQEATPPPPAVKPADSQSRLDQLRAQYEEEARRRAEAEAAARREAEAREAERRRAEQEAALLSRVRVRLRVPASLQPGAQGSIEVSVSAPQGLSLAGRHVTVVVNPGHTDERAVRINSTGAGRTVYTAPAGFNGYVRVQASLDGYGGTARSFPVGTVATPPPADTPPVTPPKPVPPTVPVPSTPAPAPPALSPEGLPIGDFTVTLSGEDGLEGRLDVRGGRASGRLTQPLSDEGVSGDQELTLTDCAYNPSSGLTQGSATFKKTIRIPEGSVTATSRVEIRLQLSSRGPARVDFTIREVGRVETTGDIEATSLDSPGDRYGFDARWTLVSR